MSKKIKQQKIFLSLAMVIILFSIVSIFYLIDATIGNDENVSRSDVKILDKQNIDSNSDVEMKEIENYVSSNAELENNYLSEIKDLHNSLAKEELERKEFNVIKITPIIEKPMIEKEINTNYSSKGKLAIIIDDVAFRYQVRKLRALDLPITLSFFPSDRNHPQTSKFAKKQLIPMVHFPLEAVNFKNEEIDTLHVGDSYEIIENRVKQIVRQFPDLRFTNNHTGSKFTSDYTSMRILLTILKQHNIQFVDSVTTSKSTVRKISKELGLRYMRRNIFIDNQLEVSKIILQLKKAIARAKKYGTAIAIGHPHKATIKALSKIKPYLNGVTLVFISKI